MDEHPVQLRAEQSGGGSGRIYTLTITAWEANGNTSTQTVQVSVPHDSRSAAQPAGSGADESGHPDVLSLKVYSNPTTGAFTFVSGSRPKLPMSVRVLDARGKVVETGANVTANGTFSLGWNYRAGTYFIEAWQGGQKVVKKLVKQ